MKKHIKKDCSGSVPVRLSPAQVRILAPALNLLVHSYRTHKQYGASPLAYPFRILPPPRDRGAFNQTLMDGICDLEKSLRSKSKYGRRIKLDTWQLRGASFAVRIYVDYLRMIRRQQRNRASSSSKNPIINGASIAEIKSKSKKVIGSMERHMKRANRALIKFAGEQQYQTMKHAWRAHLRWMRLRIVYCKPWFTPVPGRRVRFRRDLDVLREIASRGLQERGYRPPQEETLRSILRLYARYAREGRIAPWVAGFLHEDKSRFNRKHYLAQFIIDRSKMRRLSKNDEQEK